MIESSLEQMPALKLNPAFAKIVGSREHSGYWLSFETDPEVSVGDTVELVVDDVVFGYVEVYLVDLRGNPTTRWFVHWDSNSFQFPN